MSIQKLGYDFTQMAAKQNKKLMSLPLKDNATAKILWNSNEVDCFVVKDGKLEGARGASGSKEFVAEELGIIFDRLAKFVEPGVDILKAFVKASFK